MSEFLPLSDEPTSAVDPQNRRDFWESLHALLAHDQPEPEETVRKLLEEHRVRASLEDVFVAATGFESDEAAALRAAATG